MKKTILFLLGFLVWCTAFSQHTYYYGDKGPQTLLEDRRTVVVHFNEPEHFGFETAVKAPGLAKYFVAGEYSDRIILVFEKDQIQNPEEIAAYVGFVGKNIRSTSWGYRLDSGFELRLTHRVMYQASATQAELYDFLENWDIEKLGHTPTGFTYFELSDINQVIALSNALVESGLVHWAHPDFMAKADPLADPFYPEQAYLNNTGQSVNGFTGTVNIDINAPEAWAITTGSSSVIVAVVDQGVEPHEDLQDASSVSRVLTGYTTSNPSSATPGQPLGTINEAHGQGCSGIIAASHNNIGTRGIAPEVKILPVHVILEPTTPTSQFADGINWARRNGAWIINNSWAFPDCSFTSPDITAAIDSATQFGRGGLGCLVSFATGHDAQSCVTYPGNLVNTLAVSAVSTKGLQTDYANYGVGVDVVVPSSPNNSLNNVRIIDRMGNLGYNRSDNQVVTQNYTNLNYSRWFGGTSSACAMVSGIGALMLSVRPTLTYLETMNIMRNSTTDLGATGYDNIFGYGLLRADLAVNNAINASLPVELLTLSASPELEGIRVNWATATELNSSFFGVERSYDGTFFEEIGQVIAAGNSKEAITYQFLDANTQFGPRYYRLKMVDQDGSFSYTYVVQATMPWLTGSGISGVYWDNDAQQLSFNLMELNGKKADLVVLDISGRTLHRSNVDIRNPQQLLSLELPGLAAGAYILMVSAPGTETLHQKFGIVR